jgi:hypothetical protein
MIKNLFSFTVRWLFTGTFSNINFMAIKQEAANLMVLYNYPYTTSAVVSILLFNTETEANGLCFCEIISTKEILIASPILLVISSLTLLILIHLGGYG